MKSLLRMLSALLGSALGAALLALNEARVVRATQSVSDPWSLLLLLYGLIAPLGLALGAAVGGYLLLVTNAPVTPSMLTSRLRSLPILERSRLAAGLPIAVLAVFSWTTFLANVAPLLLARGEPSVVSGELGALALGSAIFFAALGVAALSPLRRLLARLASGSHRWVDPVTTLSAALVVVGVFFFLGVSIGDDSGGGPRPLSVYGVLARKELDLRPVTGLLALAVASLVGQALFGASRGVWLAVALTCSSLVATERASVLVAPPLFRAVEQGSPLGRVLLGVLRRASDRDHDGYSARFGGGDCDDGDKGRSPSAIDVPGNGIDEDCSGADLPRVEKPAPHPEKKVVYHAEPDANLVLVTIDTLRTDVGFLGYPKAVTPNLDRLAKESTVFERAYSMASYTGKALAPIVIGKYPSETKRNGAHFNAYEKGNTFIAERLHDASVHTMLAGSHIYFQPWSGVAQGFDEVDLSAKAPTEGESDSVITSAKVTDAALRMLDRNGSRRFFLWVHYFDPHALYQPHPEAPSFADGSNEPNAIAKAAYDGEVWFTDHHVGRLLDRIAKAPWGSKTNIVVTSDHGEAFGEHGMFWHGVEIWEPLVRVPLIVHAVNAEPRRIAENRSHIDLVPTMMDLMGLPAAPEGELSGVSLLGDVVGSSAHEVRDVYIDMPAGPHNSAHRALIYGRAPGTKLLHFGAQNYALFDLAKDPGEEHDLSSDRAMLDDAVSRLGQFRARLSEKEVKPEAQ